MSTSPKQMVLRSLKSLHKAKIKALFRIKAIRRQRRDLAHAEKAMTRELDGILRKMEWEIEQNGKLLGGRD